MFFSPLYVEISLAILTILLIVIYKFFTRNLDYWKKRDVSGPPPKPFVGNLWDILRVKKSLGSLLKEFYDTTDEPYMGIFNFDEPALLIRDPEIIKHVLVKDFNHFTDRILHAPSHNELFSSLLFTQKSPQWKTDRTKLTPTFSSSKIKGVFPIIECVCDELVKYIKSNPTDQDTRDTFLRFALEVTTQAFLGIRGQCFDREESGFSKQFKALIGASVRNSLIQNLYFLKGRWIDLLRLDFIQSGVEDFFRNVFWECMRNVEKMEVKPNNFISSLSDLRNNDPVYGK